jgi:hypothetical protein
MELNTLAQIESAISNPFAFPGGYPTYLVMSDYGVICVHCAEKERELIFEATIENGMPEWKPIAQEINYEESDLICDHCGNYIESAYGDNYRADPGNGSDFGVGACEE